MDSSVSPKAQIWFLRVCHHILNAVYLQQCWWWFKSSGTLQHVDWFFRGNVLSPSPWFITLFQFIFPFTPTSSKWSLPYRFTHQNPICVSVSPHTFQVPHQFHTSPGHPKDMQAIWIFLQWGLEAYVCVIFQRFQQRTEGVRAQTCV
jgi:hypothetical protein